MGTNVEIKARVKNTDRLRCRIEAISDAPCVELWQEDVFFTVPNGRLKLRSGSSEYGELIYYEREDAIDPKPSRYLLAKTTDPAALQAVLTTALGFRGSVRKRRSLYRVGGTRIHLDKVEGLGTYLELEVVLDQEGSVEEGRKIALDLMRDLDVDPADLLSGAYIDLLEVVMTRKG